MFRVNRMLCIALLDEPNPSQCSICIKISAHVFLLMPSIICTLFFYSNAGWHLAHGAPTCALHAQPLLGSLHSQMHQHPAVLQGQTMGAVGSACPAFKLAVHGYLACTARPCQLP